MQNKGHPGGAFSPALGRETDLAPAPWSPTIASARSAGEILARLESHGQDLEVEDAEAYGQYLLPSRLDVLFTLRELVKQGGVASVYFNDGRAAFLTRLLAIGRDENFLILQPGPDPAGNREALAADGLTLVTRLEHVKIQFELAGLGETVFEGRPAFLSPLPGAILRLQRREFFRLETLPAEPVHCHLPVPRGGPSRAELDIVLLDISGGGLCLKLASDAAPYLPVGKVLAGCHLLIPRESEMTLDLRVRNAFPVAAGDRPGYIRAGCEYVRLAGAGLNRIQRYISRVEHRRLGRPGR